jgi:hypothetical protein
VANFGGYRDVNGACNATAYPDQQLQIASVHRYPGNSGSLSNQRADVILFKLAYPFKIDGQQYGADDDWHLSLYPNASSTLADPTAGLPANGATATCYGWGGCSPKLRSATFKYDFGYFPRRTTVSGGSVYNADLIDIYPTVSGETFQGGDSGGGCFVSVNGTQFLATGLAGGGAPFFEYAFSSSSTGASDIFGPELGIRQWVGSVLFSDPAQVGSHSGLARVAVSSQGKGSLDAFWVDTTSNTLKHIAYGAGSWSSIDDLGNPPSATLSNSSQIGAVSWAQGRIDVFVLSTSGQVWQQYYTSTNGWSGWGQIVLSNAPSSFAGGIAAASWSANRLDLFSRGSDGHVWHAWYDNGWGSWESFPISGLSAVESPAAVSWGSNRIDIFTRVSGGSSGPVYHKWWDGSWHAWENLGGDIVGSPAVASFMAGRLDLFGVGASPSNLFHRWFEAAWVNEWIDLGKSLDSSPTAVSWGPSRVDLIHKCQNSSNMCHIRYPR